MITYFNCAGHNKKSVGAAYFNTTEERQTRETRDEVSTNLLPYNINVVKDNDDFSLTDTIKWINKNCKSGDIAIEIHFNASKKHNARGVEGWVYTGNAKIGLLCRNIVKRISDYTGMKNRGVKYSDKYAFIRDTKCDAIILECGFLDSEFDAKIILDPNNDDLISKAISDEMVSYMGLSLKTPQNADLSEPEQLDDEDFEELDEKLDEILYDLDEIIKILSK